jgi:hypothetical protein
VGAGRKHKLGGLTAKDLADWLIVDYDLVSPHAIDPQIAIPIDVEDRTGHCGESNRLGGRALILLGRRPSDD